MIVQSAAQRSDGSVIAACSIVAPPFGLDRFEIEMPSSTVATDKAASTTSYFIVIAGRAGRRMRRSARGAVLVMVRPLGSRQ